MKWWLIAWREIRWEVFFDRGSLLRTGIFVVIPLLIVLTTRSVPEGQRGDLALLSLAIQSALVPALTGVGLIASTFTQEKENGTLVPLLAAPIRDVDVVAGKLVGMLVPVMTASATTLGAAYLFASLRFGRERVADVLTIDVLYALLVTALLYVITTGSVAIIVAARARSSRSAQQVSAFITILATGILAALALYAVQLEAGWPLVALGAGLVLFDAAALAVAARAWQRGEVIARI